MMPQEVASLPVGMRDLWQGEFQRLRTEEGWGAKEAEALAWRIFGRGAGRQGELNRPPGREEAVWRQRVWGGTPEWLRLLEAPGRRNDPDLLVDRRALAAIMAHWDERGSDLLITLGAAAGVSPPWPLLPVPGDPAGWLRQLEGRQDGLWGRVEWTELIMALMEGDARGVKEVKWELRVRYQLDLSRRPVVLRRAELVPTAVWRPVAGYELGEPGWL